MRRDGGSVSNWSRTDQDRLKGKQKLGLIGTLLLGLAGSVIGGVIANLLGTGSIFELNILGFVVAVIASVLLVGTAERLSARAKK